MRRLPLLLLAVAGYAMAGPSGLKPLPEKVQATRVKSATFLRLIPVTEGGPSTEVVHLEEDSGLTQAGQGWYFTNFGYERMLVKTAEIQVELDKLRAQVRTCTPSPVITVPAVETGFSAQSLLLAGVFGTLVGGGAVFLTTRGSSNTAHR